MDSDGFPNVLKEIADDVDVVAADTQTVYYTPLADDTIDAMLLQVKPPPPRKHELQMLVKPPAMKKPAAADTKKPAAANTKRPAAAGTAASEETTRKTRGTLIAKKSLGLATVDV